MSNYAAWDLYSLMKRWVEWRHRAATSPLIQQRSSYTGELRVIEAEIDRKFFTGPYFPTS
jgi:hypothetical protein